VRSAILPLSLVALIVLVVALGSGLFIVDETEQVVITQFGEPVGAPIQEPGLKWKLPFVQKANRFEKRFLEWDGASNQVTTKDKRFIHVDTYARWRIVDPLKYLQQLRGDEQVAQSRLDDILDGETRNTIAKHRLIEVVRSSNRAFAISDELGASIEEAPPEIKFGRDELAAEVLANASSRSAVADWGIEILDFRFKRINYVEKVRKDVYARMISERQRIAEQFRSEGAGEAARINGEKERELKKISSEAYRQEQEIKGTADAEAADIYAAAYEQDAEFYAFLKSMQVFEDAFAKDSTLVLGTDGDLLKYLERAK